MAQNPAITEDQLRNREIAAADLISSDSFPAGAGHVITAPGRPLSVFGRKIAGHDA